MTREEKIARLEQIQRREALMHEWQMVYAAHMGTPTEERPEAMLRDYVAADLGLPLGTVLTDSQLFRIALAKGWCSTPEQERSLLAAERRSQSAGDR